MEMNWTMDLSDEEITVGQEIKGPLEGQIVTVVTKRNSNIRH